MAGPLSHIRVLDLSRVLAGPWAGQNLADLGADVSKVERPGSGDDSRAFGPPWVKDRDGRDSKDSAYYTSANRGKKSITLSTTEPGGQKLARGLAKISDVLIENYKFGDLARYGLSYEDLKKINPRLIYCSVTGFGQTGPYRERPGYDFMIQGMGGMMSVTGEPDDAPGGGPQRAGVPVADIINGMYASIAICAALAHRAEGGVGQQLDLELLGSRVPRGGRGGASPRSRAPRLADRAPRLPEQQLLLHRLTAQADRQPAPEHRAVSAVPHPGRQRDPRLR